MRIIRRVSGSIAILLAVTGCGTATHATTTASTTLPTCDKTLIELNHLSTSINTKALIPKSDPGPMRLCRYRWNNDERKLVLISDIARPLAPVALLRAFSRLKALDGVYSPRARFACPMSQGNADILILRAPKGSALTVLDIQRDSCGWVLLTHPGSTSYVAYLGATRLDTLLDAITAPLKMQTKNLPKIRLTPPTNLRDGQQVLLQIFGASPNERFRISECATSVAANVAGCGEQLAAQPFIDTDGKGVGATMFTIFAKAATMPYNNVGFQPCTVKCVIMVTGTNVKGQSTFVYAPLRFQP